MLLVKLAVQLSDAVAPGSLKLPFTTTDIDVDPFQGVSHPTNTRAFIYFTQESTSNDILEQGETAVLAIAYTDAERPIALDKIKAEIIVPSGAALTVERQVPTITNQVVDLG